MTYDEEDSGAPAGSVWDVRVPEETARPEPYFPGSHRDTTDAPEKRLMLAILLDAVVQLRNSGSADITEIESWIRDQDASDEPFSFTNVCAVLDIESSYLRRGLLALRDRPTGRSRRIRHIRVA